MKNFVIGIISLFVLFLGWNVIDNRFDQQPYTAEPSGYRPETFGADASKLLGGAVYYLSGSGISSSATSLTLTSLTIPQNGYEIQDSDLSSTFYITIEPGSRTKQEFVSCTTVTQNADNTATLSGCSRGLSPIAPYTASTSLQFAHSGGKQVVFSNPPSLYNDITFKNNDETITGIYTFSTLPEASTLATATNQLTNKQYVDNVANQGAATATEAVAGIAELATAVEAASSTDNGMSDPLVLQAKYATDTPDNCASSPCVVMSWLGKIKQSWIDLTEAWTFTGGVTFNSATTTLNSTSSIAATTNNPVLFNSIDYTFPSAEGASSTVLATNGSGVLTWQNVDQHFAAATSSDTTVTDTTSETTYGTGDFGTLPGQTLGSYGTLHAKVFVSNYQHTVAGTSNVILRLKLGGTTVCQVTFQDAETTAGDAIADMWMSNDGSSDSQFCQSTGSVSTVSATNHQFHSEGYTTSSVDTSSDQAITLTIQWNANNAGETETVTVSSLSVQAF